MTSTVVRVCHVRCQRVLPAEAMAGDVVDGRVTDRERLWRTTHVVASESRQDGDDGEADNRGRGPLSSLGAGYSMISGCAAVDGMVSYYVSGGEVVYGLCSLRTGGTLGGMWCQPSRC